MKQNYLPTLNSLFNLLRGNTEKQRAANTLSLRNVDLSRTRFINTATSKIPVFIRKSRSSNLEVPTLAV